MAQAAQLRWWAALMLLDIDGAAAHLRWWAALMPLDIDGAGRWRELPRGCFFQGGSWGGVWGVQGLLCERIPRPGVLLLGEEPPRRLQAPLGASTLFQDLNGQGPPGLKPPSASRNLQGPPPDLSQLLRTFSVQMKGVVVD